LSGKHIELFLVDGVPGGITTAEIAGWTGHVLSGPRSDIADVLARSEAQRNGAYFLLGDDAEALGGTRCYIGRTESFSGRFRDHRANKDFWDRVVIITSKDESFNEGHWGYLESRLVDLAKRAQRVDVVNDQSPQLRKLSEAQISDVEAFLAHLHIVLPVLGVNAVRERTQTAIAPAVAASPSPIFRLRNAKAGVDAQAQVNGEEFTVLAGSRVVGAWTATGNAASTRRAYDSYRAQHDKLVADGSIAVEGHIGRLTRDVAFTSPSTAGAVAMGRSCNGRIEWQWDDGTYGEWEERGLS